MEKRYQDEAPPFLRDFTTYMEVILGRTKKTVDNYYIDIRLFLRYLLVLRGFSSMDEFETISIQNMDIELLKTVTLHDLYDFLAYTSSERLNNANSRSRKISALRSFFKYLNAKAKLIPGNPAAELDSPKKPQQLPKYLTLSESVQLLGVVDGNNALRDYAILTIFLNCGLRLSELVGINLPDIRDDKLTVLGKGNKERTIYLNPACTKAIDAYVKNERPTAGIKPQHQNALFISRNMQRIGVSMVQKLVKRYIKAAGLDETKYSVHKLRHTAATLMYQYGHVDVRVLQEILGHSELSTTQIYTHLDNEQVRDAVQHNPLAEQEQDIKQHQPEDTDAVSDENK